jgi:type IV pilus assembly protein PilC
VSLSRSSPRLDGREAAHLLRVLAAARARELPLLPAVVATAGLAGLRQLRRLLPVLREAGEAGLLDAIEAALGRGVDAPAAAMLQALRHAGAPAAGLRNLADWCGTRAADRSMLFRAVSYPITLMITVAIVFVLLFHGLGAPYLVGEFKAMYTHVGVELPWLTRAAFALYAPATAALSVPWAAPLYLAVVLAVAYGFLRYGRNLPDRGLALYIPMVNRYVRFEAAKSFSDTLALLLKNKVPAPAALALAADAVSNEKLRRGLAGMIAPVVAGESLGEVLRQATALPRSLSWRLWSAYFRADLVTELERVSATCASELAFRERRVRSLATFVAWMIVFIFLAPTVGVLVVAMYLPMFHLISVIG